MVRNCLCLFVIAIFLIPMTSEAKKLKLLMFTWAGKNEADDAFLARGKELGLEFEVTHFDLNQDKALMGKIYRDTKWKDFDFVYTYATPATKAAMVSSGGQVPIIFVMVSYPVEAGLVDSWNKSGKKISGISNNIMVAKQFDVVLGIKPMKKVGILLNPNEENVNYALADFESESKKRGIQTTVYRTASEVDHIKQALQQVIKDYKDGKIEGLMIPPSSYYNSKAAEFMPILADAGVFSFTTLAGVNKFGSTVGILYDRVKVAKMAADLIKSIVDGKKIEDTAIQMDDTPAVVFNKRSVEKTAVKVPPGAKMVE